MLVGWGGNNGTTITAGILANQKKLSWQTKERVIESNWFGSLTQVHFQAPGAHAAPSVFGVRARKISARLCPETGGRVAWRVIDRRITSACVCSLCPTASVGRTRRH